MPSKFNFRVSAISLSCLVCASALISLAVCYGNIYGFGNAIRSLTQVVEPKNAFNTIAWLRGCTLLFAAVFPFRAHLNARPPLFAFTFASVFVGTLIPWLILGSLTKDLLTFVLFAHGWALIMYFLLLLWVPKPESTMESAPST